MENLDFFGDVAEWEESDEKFTVGNNNIPRYARIDEIVNILAQEGSSMDYHLLMTVLVCLPSISSPLEFCQSISRVFSCSDTMSLNDFSREQVHLKVLVILRAWAKSPSAYCDFSGPIIENALDIVKDALNSDIESVVYVAKKVRASLKMVRNDLREVNRAQEIYKERVAVMTSFLRGRNRVPSEDRTSFHDKSALDSLSEKNFADVDDDLDEERFESQSAPSFSLPDLNESINTYTGMNPSSRESFASISLNGSRLVIHFCWDVSNI